MAEDISSEISGEFLCTSLVINKWLGTARRQAITLANVDRVPRRHVA